MTAPVPKRLRGCGVDGVLYPATDAALPLSAASATLLAGALVPDGAEGYQRRDVLIKDGKIARISPPSSADAAAGCEVLDCTERLLLPGFVNAHTHSSEHWARGLFRPLPLELWVQQLIRNEPRGEKGWCGAKSFTDCPSEAIGVSAMTCAVESLLSGCTAVLDHLFVRGIDDIAAAVAAYRAVGVRCFIAPMLNDDKDQYINYCPLARDPDPATRNAAAGSNDAGGMGPGGKFRVQKGEVDSQKTAASLQLWEEAVQRFHDPEGGVEVVIAPVTPYSCSEELLRGAAEIRKRHNLCGHVHLLETRSQALMAKQFLPSGSAVKHLDNCGFLRGRGTSLAHSVWLDDTEQKLIAEAGAVIVHNPLSNLRLGSGVAPLQTYQRRGVCVSLGCDGACSSDGQDMLEVVKMASILPAITTPEYRDWPAPRHTALTLAAKNGYAAVGMAGTAGELRVGAEADLTLWDLTSLALLPRTDPVGLLVLGSRAQTAAGAGAPLSDAWVRGVRVIKAGALEGVDLPKLREIVRAAQPHYRCPDVSSSDTQALQRFETEYRAAMRLPIATTPLPSAPSDTVEASNGTNGVCVPTGQSTNCTPSMAKNVDMLCHGRVLYKA